MEFVALQHLLPPSNRTLVCRLSGGLFCMFYLATHSGPQNICCHIFGDDQKANEPFSNRGVLNFSYCKMLSCSRMHINLQCEELKTIQYTEASNEGLIALRDKSW
jgi:hypothetical protein